MKPRKALAAAFGGMVVAAAVTLAQAPTGDPGPQLPRPAFSTKQPCPDDPTILCVTTPQGLFPVPAPNTTTNFLKAVYTDNFTDAGVDMANTLPSTPQAPYNLIANLDATGNVPTKAIDETSPTQDLTQIFKNVIAAAQGGTLDLADIQFGIDILEGNSIPSRPTYSGIALLHYTGPEKLKSVTPIKDSNGNVIGGNVNVHEVWFDQNIESDTALLDASAVQDVPWTITYTIDILHRGGDDFAPFAMFFSDPPTDVPGAFGKPHVAMDQTFFPMTEGTEMVIQIKYPPARYWNLTYHWGWRRHPPRVQVIENALKKGSDGTITQSLPQWEVSVFGICPRCNATSQFKAIQQIGDLAPAKRMWRDLLNAQGSSLKSVIQLMQDAQQALADFNNRNQLPTGVQADPNADVTLFFVNNTIYGNQVSFPKWITRPATFNVTLINGDYYEHGYQNVDFGGTRGWENIFQSTTNSTQGGVIGGSGCWFTFGRVHWWINAGGPPGWIVVPPASNGNVPGVQKIRIMLNFEPTPRLRLYQFDPLHHDVAIYSLH